jgi:hypothetical protein
MVHDLAKVIHLHYDEFKNADPGAIGWAMESQVFDWVVPFHQGAVNYFKSIGIWTQISENHNQQMLHRQSVLSKAWEAMGDPSEYADAEYQQAWMKRRKDALIKAGLDPIWE